MFIEIFQIHRKTPVPESPLVAASIISKVIILVMVIFALAAATSTTSCEHFSMLRSFKTYFRSNTGQSRLKKIQVT